MGNESQRNFAFLLSQSENRKLFTGKKELKLKTSKNKHHTRYEFTMWNTQFAQCVFNSLWHSITIYIFNSVLPTSTASNVRTYVRVRERKSERAHSHTEQPNWHSIAGSGRSLFLPFFLLPAIACEFSSVGVFRSFFLSSLYFCCHCMSLLTGKTISIYYMCESAIGLAVLHFFSSACFI